MQWQMTRLNGHMTQWTSEMSGGSLKSYLRKTVFLFLKKTNKQINCWNTYKGQNYYSDFITNLEKNTTEVKSYSFLSKTKSQDDEDLQLLDYLLPSDAGSTTY